MRNVGCWMIGMALMAAIGQSSMGQSQIAPHSAAGVAAAASGAEIMLGSEKNTADGQKSLGASGHAIAFERPDTVRYVDRVDIFAGRYGTPEAPDENFHVYFLNEKKEVLADIPYPYKTIERSDMKWCPLLTPSIETPKQFYVALNFNPHQTKGIYLGYENAATPSRSLQGLPDSGFEKVSENYDWMVRVHLTAAPSSTLGVKKLADFIPPQVKDAFTGCIEIKFDQGESEGKQSYGGRGPAIRFKPAEFLSSTVASSLNPSQSNPSQPNASQPNSSQPNTSQSASVQSMDIKGFRIYASRYGSGYEPDKTMIKVSLQDEQGKLLWQESFPYSLFTYKPKWVDLVPSKPIPASVYGQSRLTLSIDPAAAQTKGVYFHYNKNPKSPHSLAGTVEKGFKDAPDREWMFRVYFGAK